MEQSDWRSEVSSSTETLKVKDGETVRFTFMDEGVKRESVDYGNSIAFQVLCDGDSDAKTFYVKANNFAFLAQIKALGSTLKSTHVEVSRTGTKRSDTRYTIKKI